MITNTRHNRSYVPLTTTKFLQDTTGGRPGAFSFDRTTMVGRRRRRPPIVFQLLLCLSAVSACLAAAVRIGPKTDGKSYPEAGANLAAAAVAPARFRRFIIGTPSRPYRPSPVHRDPYRTSVGRPSSSYDKLLRLIDAWIRYGDEKADDFF